MLKKYDVIIAGASFAGLAVASKIKNKKVLLIDRKKIGTGVTSACGTTIQTMEEINCEKSILQKFDKFAFHIGNKETEIPISEKYCTIDYSKFCKLLNKQNNAEFLIASVKKTDGKIVYTNKGNFEADIIVDCTGWSAVLASSLEKNYVHKKMMSFGIETEIPYKKDNKMRFFLDENIIKNGAGWLFPCGKKARFGVSSYEGDTKLLPNLEKFVGSYGLKVGKIHGGYFCYCLKNPIVKNIFVVGCAAGQTLPLTGEGIKRSINFGLLCGEIIQKILEKKITIREGQKKYQEEALKYSKEYEILLKEQKNLPHIPIWEISLIAKLLSIKLISNLMQKEYEKI
ncbi:MAG: NAD(P)/FAD-dependent oxidoreductase [Nanoarchaeota archaeon]